ncbi:type IV pilus modification protein PilV [Comamonas sp.]|uniref:type IV pilus modification protein PilV n=1 Tax=Comamonas sp. TaxID=34028 RepID=UPI0025898941|nr:type IV pilus modification protein PilV [Comamonas sp.]
MKKTTSPPIQRGFALLESLIAIVVMALGILGILGLQMRTLTNTQTSLYRAQAIRLIEDLNERLIANPNAFLSANSYLTEWKKTPSSQVNCNNTACGYTELAAFDIERWKAQVGNTLPNGNASVFYAEDEPQAENRRQLGVMISWRENESGDADEDYLKAINASTGSGEAESCPEGQTCHLQFIPVVARCAPYFAGTNVQIFCPGS